MDDIGGILFYIIAAVIGIITTVGKKKRQKAKSAVITSTIEEEVFDDSFDRVKETTYKTIPEDKFEDDFWTDNLEKNDHSAFDQVEEGSYNEPMAEQFSSEGSSTLTELREDKKVEDDITEMEGDSKKSKILKDFDLKKAVVFSEILKRKYY